MINQLENLNLNLNKQTNTTKYYKEFLSYLGIDPEDFEYEYDIEIDDYSR